MASFKELFEAAETLKLILIDRATGGSPSDGEYRSLRRMLIADRATEKLLPRFVRTCRNLSEFWGHIKEQDPRYQGRRDYLRDQFDPLLTKLETVGSVPSDSSNESALKQLDNENVHMLWQRALERRTEDPEGAITLARTLLEEVCKHILNDVAEDYDDKADLPKLYSSVSKQLNMSPAQHSEQVFKQILGGCHSVVQGLGSLRNEHGDAHAKGKRARVRPSVRHAELAVNLAGTMATFLLATWVASSKGAAAGDDPVS